MRNQCRDNEAAACCVLRSVMMVVTVVMAAAHSIRTCAHAAVNHFVGAGTKPDCCSLL